MKVSIICFFTCSSSKVLRGVLVGTNSLPISMWQCFVWFHATGLVEKNCFTLFSFLLFFSPFWARNNMTFE
jgi:hypothetical protein